MAKTRFCINLLVVLAAVVVLVAGDSMQRNSFFRAFGGLRSSVQQWDFITLDDLNVDSLRKQGSHFAFRYEVGPTLSQSNRDGSDVVANLLAASAAAATDVTTEHVVDVVGAHEAPEEHSRERFDAYGDETEDSEDGNGIVRTSMNTVGNGSNGDASSPLSGTVTSTSILGVHSGSLDSGDAAEGGMNVRSPMESLKAIWRRLMEAPPSTAQIDEILHGAHYYSSPQRNNAHSMVASDMSNGNTTNSIGSGGKNIAQTSPYSHANPLRANGTDRESMYRQMLSQFLTPLTAEGKRSLWLDQEVALRLKAAVLIAHRPELWRGIGEGLRPKLLRGVRLVTPLDETTAPGPTGVAPVHNIIAAALSHSVGANLAFLNLQNVEKVRDSALAVGVDRAFLSKANILTALVEACEDSFVETAHPAVVVIDDSPQWLLANEAAAEVVVEELKSVSSRVMFLAIAPPDVLKNGDFSPSARPAPVPPQAEIAETSGEAGTNSAFASFANLFNGASDSSSRTGTGTVGNNNRGFPFLPPGAVMPPTAFFNSAQRGGPPNSNANTQQPNMQPNMIGVPQIGAMIGRSFQVVVQNGTATMIPLPPTIVPGANNLPGGGPLSESALTKIIQDQHRAFMQQYTGGQANADGNNSTAEGNSGAGAPVGISFPLFPPDMTTEEIQEFMQDPDNQAKIKQTLDSVVHALSAQMAQKFGQHLNSLQLQPGSGGHGPSFVPNSASNPNPNPNSVEVKVQMVPLPPGMSPFAIPPFARPSPKKPNAENKVQLSDDKAAPSAIDKAMARDKPPSPPAAAQNLPGTFFGGMKKRGAADSAPDTNNASGKAKGLKGRPFMGKPIHKESSNQGSEVVDAEYRNAYSPSGMEITSLFVDYPITAPRDVTLKALWERLLDDEVASRILRLNRRMISAELRRNMVKHTVGAIKALDQILRRQVMSKEEVRQALRFALQLQAGKHSILPPANANTALRTESTSDSAAPLADVTASPTPRTSAAVDVATSTTPLSSDGDDQLVLSQWALDTAFSTVLKTPTPRLGRPAARSKDDISSLVTDKHERSLIGNVISPQDIGVTYDMIGGLDEVKEMLRQCITYPLKYPRLYQEGVAAEAVKGVLLFGPPGTGKTMLAKAVATEGGATFLTIDTSTIENKWLGESEKNARAVFQLARRLAPCVIYLDEVDSILSSREQGDESSHGTLTSVKTTLMQEWDGLRTTKDRVVVIASTNRPFDLDEAVLRRLPRRILVDLPDLHTRQEILAVTLANNRIDRSVNFTQLAEKLDGYTGSDIKEVCREAVVRVAHERAQMLEHGADSIGTAASKSAGSLSISSVKPEGVDGAAEALDFNAPLRAVTLEDFQAAMKKLKASVDDNGRELQKVVEWNHKYGEFKRKPKKSSGSSAHLSMYV